MKNLKKYSDKKLLAALGSKKKSEVEAAFTEIYDRYAIRVNAYCSSILGDAQAAEDVFQETFLKFYQKAKSEKSSGSIIGFLITIARNLCLNAKRDTKTTVSIEDFELTFEDGVSLESQETRELILTAVDLVGGEYKEALVLRYFEEFSYKNIAELLGVTEARARYLVFTAKQKIRKILEPYYDEIYNNK